MTKPNRHLSTTAQIARALRIDPKTIHNWAMAGLLRAQRTKGRHLRFLASEVARFLRSQGKKMPAVLIPERPRVAVLGMPQSSEAGEVDADYFAGFFAGALASSSGEYDVIVMAPGALAPAVVGEMVRALSENPNTLGVGLVAVSQDVEIAQAFLEGGGDVVVATRQKIGVAIDVVLGEREPSSVRPVNRESGFFPRPGRRPIRALM